MNLLGGPGDGLLVEAVGVRICVPFIDAEYEAQHDEWFGHYGVAHAMAQAADEDWTGPPPPTLPTAVYDRRGVFVEVERG